MHYFETGHWVPMILCQKHVSEENKLHSLSYTWPYIHITCIIIILVFLFSFKYLDNISLNIYTLLITITPLFYIINEIQWYTALNFFQSLHQLKVHMYSLALIYYPSQSTSNFHVNYALHYKIHIFWMHIHFIR